MEPLIGLWSVLQDPDKLEQMGFATDGKDKKGATLTKGSPEIMEEDDWAAMLAKLIISVVGHRLRSQLWLEFGLPGRLCALCSEDPEDREAVLNDLKSHVDGWRHIKDLPGQFWRKVQSRSVFQ